MTFEDVLGVLLGLLAGGGLGWALFRRRKNEPTITEPIGEQPSVQPVTDAGLKPIRIGVEIAVSDTEAVEDSPTPATDAARLAASRARRREEEGETDTDPDEEDR